MNKAIKLRLCKENVITTSSMNRSSVNLLDVDVIIVVVVAVVVAGHVDNAVIVAYFFIHSLSPIFLPISRITIATTR